VAQPFEQLAKFARSMGAVDARLIPANSIVVDPRSILKCRFGCKRWGKYWTCNPNLGITVDEFTKMLARYQIAMVLKCEDPKSGQEITLAVEKEAMMKHGAIFAFGMALCVQCEPCAFPSPCTFPEKARPSMDALGIDVVKTVASVGFKVEFDKTGNLLPAWFTMVLVE
jgi:predicted metal-binding protein